MKKRRKNTTIGEDREYISLQECLKDLETSKYKVPLCLGRNSQGEFITKDLVDIGHLLVSGSTGSGKSVFINSFINTILETKESKDIKFIMIDPKMIELPFYNGIAYLQVPVITDVEKASEALRWCVEEIHRRKNKKQKDPYLVIVVDEFADLMISDLGMDSVIENIAEKGSEVGIFMLLSTSSPRDTVITKTLGKLITKRLVGTLPSLEDSMRALGKSGAENLLGNGDMIFRDIREGEGIRLQTPLITTEDQKTVLNGVPKTIMVENPGRDKVGSTLEPTYENAKKLVIEEKQATVSFLQRRLKIGYDKAARLIDQLEYGEVISPREGTKKRKVLLDKYIPKPKKKIRVYILGRAGEEDPLLDDAKKLRKEYGFVSASLLQRKLKIGWNRAARLFNKLKEEED